jgi:predicted AlkP superfamily phosphohydrolase/phosphomutase
VDWAGTRAYALGLGGIWLNVRGRERLGVPSADDPPALGWRLAEALAGLEDPERVRVTVTSVRSREERCAGACAAESPDLVVDSAPGDRVSWGTAWGGEGRGIFEDDVRPWNGARVVEPARMPRILFMSGPFRGAGASLLDLAPTIRAALGGPSSPEMEGRSHL